MLDLAIIIVNWNTRELLRACLQSVYRSQCRYTTEVRVVDNGSSDGSQAMLRAEFPQVRCIENAENVGFARANNQAMRLNPARYYLLLNSDAELAPDACQRLVDLGERTPGLGIAGAQLFNPDGSFQAASSPFPSLWSELLVLSGLGRLIHGRWYPSRGPLAGQEPLPADYVEGACLLARRAAVEQVGGLDEGYFMYAEEVDWCYRMRSAGWGVWLDPGAHVVHHGGASSARRRVEREADLYCGRVRFFRLHYGARQAGWLRRLILAATWVKAGWHRALRIATRGRRGRQVAPLDALSARLKEA